MDKKLCILNHLVATEKIFKEKLIDMLKPAVFVYYKGIFDCYLNMHKKNQKKAVEAFQHCLSTKNDTTVEMNKIIMYTKCPEISKLIEVILMANQKMLLLTSNVPIEFYEKPAPQVHIFFQTLLYKIRLLLYRFPYFFCAPNPGTQIHHNFRLLNEISNAIHESICVASFKAEILGFYKQQLNDIQFSLMGTNMEQVLPMNDIPLLPEKGKKKMKPRILNAAAIQPSNVLPVSDVRVQRINNTQPSMGMRQQNDYDDDEPLENYEEPIDNMPPNHLGGGGGAFQPSNNYGPAIQPQAAVQVQNPTKRILMPPDVLKNVNHT